MTQSFSSHFDAADTCAVQAIRALSMDAVQAANSGHPGTPMALAELGWVLFAHLRRHDPQHPQWINRDRFVLSCGHASMLQYALLHLSGYDLSLDDIRQFRQWQSRTPGHPEYGHTPGVEITTGPLGQGIASAVGMAIAERQLALRFNTSDHMLIDHHTYVIASDGDLMEGVSAEASSLAGHLKLRKLIAFWDDNRITIDGNTDLSFAENVMARYRAYGWSTLEVDDARDMEALYAAAQQAQSHEKPTLIRVRSIIGYPAPTKQNSSSAHGAPLGADEIKATRDAMQWPHAPFVLPSELAEVTSRCRKRGEEQWREWNERQKAYQANHPKGFEAFRRAFDLENTLAQLDWPTCLPQFKADQKGLATRAASGQVLQALAAQIPEMVGGSADLAGSNQSYLTGFADFHTSNDSSASESTSDAPRNIHWGVREHAMGAALNGMALHGGMVPFGATFLVFSDYMRPAMRLAALMNLPVRYIFTHDSIGLGEDGPTHQPIEHLASLRCIPNMMVMRPSDANEVSVCWRLALQESGPVAMILTRQSLPTLDRSRFTPAEQACHGAYSLIESKDRPLQVVIMATGSEVSLALQAFDTLDGMGIGTRVLSMPSWELFAQQDQEYRDTLLPPTCSARIAVEAGCSMGWERWLGERGRHIGLDHFGASAPYEQLYQHFGITVDAIVSAAQELIAKS